MFDEPKKKVKARTAVLRLRRRRRHARPIGNR